jgi:hypothetical protein
LLSASDVHVARVPSSQRAGVTLLGGATITRLPTQMVATTSGGEMSQAPPSGIGGPNQPPNTNATALLELLERRSFATYQARLRASKRLMTRNNAWNASLIAASTATTIASVALLANNDIYGTNGETLFVCLAVLSLTASLVTSGLNYSGRSRDMFSNYRRIQRLSAEAERAKQTPSMQTFAVVEELNAKYDELLDGSENHTEADFFHANRTGRKPSSVWSERLLSFFPYVSLIIPVLLLPPLIRWMF